MPAASTSLARMPVASAVNTQQAALNTLMLVSADSTESDAAPVMEIHSAPRKKSIGGWTRNGPVSEIALNVMMCWLSWA